MRSPLQINKGSKMILLICTRIIEIQDLQSQPKVLGTLKPYRVTPFPPNQCWKIARFFQQKGQKSPDYQH